MYSFVIKINKTKKVLFRKTPLSNKVFANPKKKKPWHFITQLQKFVNESLQLNQCIKFFSLQTFVHNKLFRCTNFPLDFTMEFFLSLYVLLERRQRCNTTMNKEKLYKVCFLYEFKSAGVWCLIWNNSQNLQFIRHKFVTHKCTYKRNIIGSHTP